MSGERFSTAQSLSDEIEIALRYAPFTLRGAMRAFFMFDRHLAQLTTRTREPMLGQMRLAWWREMLASEPQEWPRGDAVLDAIAHDWQGGRQALIGLVDGWEELLAEPPLTRAGAQRFIIARSTAMRAIAPDMPEEGGTQKAGMHWALGDLAARTSHVKERAMLLDLADQLPVPARLPSRLKAMAILDALGARALRRGGRVLMEGRGAALTIFRIAVLGK